MVKKRVAHITEECVACGNCVRNCPLGAITVYRGLFATVDHKKCVGCGRCAAACPADVIRLTPRENAS